MSRKATTKKVPQEEEEYDENEEEEYYDEEDGDDISPPEFLEASNLQEDEEEINYYAKKLGLDPTIDDWDDYMISNGYSKLLDGITSSRISSKKKEVKMVKAVRTTEEESARKDFTGLLNRIAPSNFAVIAAQLREAYAARSPKVSCEMFTRCITQRLYSDAVLPDMFIDVYSRALKEVPDAIQSVLDKLHESDKKESKNIKNFIKALGEDMVSFYSTDSKGKQTVDEEVSKLTALARKLHMTTDVRRGVFYALMTAADVPDASAKIAKLQLSKTMRKDVPIVIMECCRNEAKYNPYYAAVADFLAQNDKVFQHALTTAIKNTMKLAKDLDINQIKNSGLFIADIVAKGTIDLGYLRGIQLTKVDAKAQTMILVFFAEFFRAAEPGIIDDELTKLENAPNFGADIGKFLSHRGIKHVESKKNYPKDRINMMKHYVEELTKVQ